MTQSREEQLRELYDKAMSNAVVNKLMNCVTLRNEDWSAFVRVALSQPEASGAPLEPLLIHNFTSWFHEEKEKLDIDPSRSTLQMRFIQDAWMQGWKSAAQTAQLSTDKISAATASPLDEPWLYAIEETNAAGASSWHDGENCVFGDRESAQDEVDLLNDDYPDEQPFRVVPLYRTSQPQPCRNCGLPSDECECLGLILDAAPPAAPAEVTAEMVRQAMDSAIKRVMTKLQTQWVKHYIGEAQFQIIAEELTAALAATKGGKQP